MKFSILTCLAAALFIAPAASSTAHASDEAQAPPSLSITVSPIHLFLPVVEASAEFALARSLSVAGIVGVGRVDDLRALEVGGQLRYIAWGSFRRALQIGVEALYLTIDDDPEQANDVGGAGLAIGPLLGYKHAFQLGLTFDVQIGVQYIVARAADASEEHSDIVPLINLNAGWTF